MVLNSIATTPYFIAMEVLSERTKTQKEHSTLYLQLLFCFISEPFNLPKVISLSLEPSEKLSNADNQIPDPDIWNIGEQG